MRLKPLVGLLSGGGMFVLLLLGASVIHGGIVRPDFALTLLLGLFGVSLGWLVGLLASPYDDVEMRRFGQYAAVLSTFLTGYVAGKVDPVITRILARDPVAIDLVTSMRLVLFGASIVIGTIASYSYRSYLFGPKPRQQL